MNQNKTELITPVKNTNNNNNNNNTSNSDSSASPVVVNEADIIEEEDDDDDDDMYKSATETAMFETEEDHDYNNHDEDDDDNSTIPSPAVIKLASYVGNVYEVDNSHRIEDNDDDNNNNNNNDTEEDDEDRASSRLVRRRKSQMERENSIPSDNNNNTNYDRSLLSEPYTKQLSRRLSSSLQRRQSDIIEALPETPSGWAVLVSMIASIGLGHEVQLQKKLTHPPKVYGQIHNTNSPIYSVYNKMISNNNNKKKDNSTNAGSIIQRPIQPSLFVGTRATAASTAAYLFGGPSSSSSSSLGTKRKNNCYIQFREILNMPHDGAQIATDWELPPANVAIDFSINGTKAIDDNNYDTIDDKYITMTDEERKSQVMNGPIEQPVIIILHGINNDSSFGYIRSLMRTCTDRGWIAVGFNFRGCGGVPLTTPRGYTGGFTGDLRSTIQIISSRLKPGVPIFLVGNSLGGNLVAKYLGEEGKNGTLPTCIAGGVTLGNAMSLDATKLNSLWSSVLTLGAKLHVMKNYKYFKQMKTFQYKDVMWKLFLKVLTLEDFDRTLSPLYIRNDPDYPFTVHTRGYDTAEEYWQDSSSSRVIQFVSVPVLQLIAKDDFLIFAPHLRSMNKNTSNPNIMVIETTCGGHLGWQESKPGSILGSSWADIATAEFIHAVLDLYHEKWQQKHTSSISDEACNDDNTVKTRNKNTRRHDDGNKSKIIKKAMEDAMKEASELRSRL